MYGKVDYFRLIDTMRILPNSEYENSTEPALGVELGGIHLVENLLISRYFMYSQVYFHHVRKIYDLHLKDYMESLYPNKSFPLNLEQFLSITDNEIFAQMRQSLVDRTRKNHNLAKIILCRKHFKCIHRGRYQDKEKLDGIYKKLTDKFGKDKIKKFDKLDKDEPFKFPVLKQKNETTTAREASQMIGREETIPKVSVFYIYAARDISDNASEDVKNYIKEML
jgi:HD superfamily phosphohydrolase